MIYTVGCGMDLNFNEMFAGLIELPITFDSLSVVVNPKNTFVDCLTVQELKTIWEPAASHGCSARAWVSCRHCSR